MELFLKFLLGDRPAQKVSFYREALLGNSQVSSCFLINNLSNDSLVPWGCCLGLCTFCFPPGDAQYITGIQESDKVRQFGQVAGMGSLSYRRGRDGSLGPSHSCADQSPTGPSTWTDLGLEPPPEP